MDTLDPERLKRLMRFGTLAEIEAGIAAAEDGRAHADQDQRAWSRATTTTRTSWRWRAARRSGDWHVRFIELMPLGGGEAAHVALSQFVPSQETRRRIEAALGPLEPMPRTSLADESRNYRFADGGPGVVGFISPVSEPYCGSCNRMRLTADGKFHLCLLNDDELDVKRALRSGGGLTEVAAILTRAVGLKPTGHRLDEGVSTEERAMFQIGG